MEKIARYQHSSMGMGKSESGHWVEFVDHEAALAAANERIAELERKVASQKRALDGAASSLHRLMEYSDEVDAELEALRTAIGRLADAREKHAALLRRQCDEDATFDKGRDGRMKGRLSKAVYYKESANELRALEKQK